jgi:hypothetical protein
MPQMSVQMKQNTLMSVHNKRDDVTVELVEIDTGSSYEYQVSKVYHDAHIALPSSNVSERIADHSRAFKRFSELVADEMNEVSEHMLAGY